MAKWPNLFLPLLGGKGEKYSKPTCFLKDADTSTSVLETCYIYDLQNGFHLDKVKVHCHKNGDTIVVDEVLSKEDCPQAQQQRSVSEDDYAGLIINTKEVTFISPNIRIKSSGTISLGINSYSCSN